MQKITDIRREFPIFGHYPDLAWLDNAATTQKPRQVLEAERYFYERQNANILRGIYPLAAAATEAFEAVREQTRAFLNARSTAEIIFTGGTTEGINLVAQCFVAGRLQEGDAVLVSILEHHANFVPWQQICRQKKARLLVAPVRRDGSLDLDALAKMMLEHGVRFLAIAHVSNTLGSVNPIAGIIAQAHRHGIPVLVDAAQSAAALPLDVQLLDADFLAFSGHKLFGPTGVGVLYGKQELLEQMPPYRFGGEMIRDVTFERTLFAPLPQKFEAGTPNIAGVMALGAALDFIRNLDREAMHRQVQTLLAYATDELRRIPGLEIVGQASVKAGILSFVLGDVHPHDVATILGEQQICIRAGHHCAQPLMDFMGMPGTARASFAFYNTEIEVERFVKAVNGVRRYF